MAAIVQWRDTTPLGRIGQEEKELELPLRLLFGRGLLEYVETF